MNEIIFLSKFHTDTMCRNSRVPKHRICKHHRCEDTGDKGFGISGDALGTPQRTLNLEAKG